MWEAPVWHRDLSLVLCDGLEGWDGVGGRETQDRGHICIHIANSCCCTAETNTNGKVIILQFKKKKLERKVE